MKQVKLLWGIVSILTVAVVVLLLLLSRSGGSAHAPAPSPSANPEDPLVARIGDREIRSSMLKEALLHKEGATTLSQMIDHAVLQMEADELKLKLTAPEIDAELKRMQQGYESEEQFYQSMKEQLGMTKDDLREDVYYKLLLEKIATLNVEVSTQEVESYITAHPEEFKARVQLQLQQIINQTLDQAKRTVELARSGKDFAQLARDRSIDTTTANEGGDLGWVEEDDPFVPNPIMKAAALLKVGDISEPVQLENGTYAVVKLNERREQQRGTPDEIRESVRKQLALQKGPSFKEVMTKLRQKRNVQIIDPALRP